MGSIHAKDSTTQARAKLAWQQPLTGSPMGTSSCHAKCASGPGAKPQDFTDYSAHRRGDEGCGSSRARYNPMTSSPWRADHWAWSGAIASHQHKRCAFVTKLHAICPEFEPHAN